MSIATPNFYNLRQMEFLFQSLTEFKLDFHPSTYTLTSYLKSDATFWNVTYVREQRGCQ